MVVSLHIQECMEYMRAVTFISLERTYRFSYIASVSLKRVLKVCPMSLGNM